MVSRAYRPKRVIKLRGVHFSLYIQNVKTYCCAGVRNHGTGDEFTIVEDDTPRPPGRMCLRDAVFDILNVLALTDPPHEYVDEPGARMRAAQLACPCSVNGRRFESGSWLYMTDTEVGVRVTLDDSSDYSAEFALVQE